MAPITTPIVMAASADAMPISSETRAPCATPAATSRPSVSPPSHIPSSPGGAKGVPLISHGETGKTTGRRDRDDQDDDEQDKPRHSARVPQEGSDRVHQAASVVMRGSIRR